MTGDDTTTETATDAATPATESSNTTETTMTANDTSTTGASRERTGTTNGPRATMSGVDQTHPETNRSFGFAVYGRGVAADGGREQEEESMEDVDHEADTEGAGRTFERGKDSTDDE